MAGSDAGHAFAALGLARTFVDAGEAVVVYTGDRWIDEGRRCGLDVRELPGLAARDGDDDADAGAKLTVRAARMAVELSPLLAADAVDVVIGDVITRAGGWAAELNGVPWIELSPHPLYEQSRGLPPIGAGMAAGEGIVGRLRDRVLRAMSARAVAAGRRDTAAARAGIGLGPVPRPLARFVATLPGLEVARPDWPIDAHLIGPALHEPTDTVFARPDGTAPLVVVAPSTARTGEADLGRTALAALAEIARTRPVRVVYSALTPSPDDGPVPPGLVAGTGRQDEVLRDAAVVVCGAGHGMLAKTLLAGVPVVTVPGGGDQWELANRVVRAGAGRLVRPARTESVAAAIVAVLDDPSHAAAAARIAATAAATVDPVAMTRRLLERGSHRACA